LCESKEVAMNSRGARFLPETARRIIFTVRSPQPTLALNASLFRPGLRLAVGLSGGADSVALFCALADRGRELGLVLHAAHLHHGLRGDEADADLAFCRDLAAQLRLPFHQHRVDIAAEARRARSTSSESEKNTEHPRESIEGVARRLRYRWFRDLMSAGEVDAVATAHTLDDQAETVLAKFLRGAWTEGFSGVHPVLEFPEGRILRPLLGTTRAQIEAFLHASGRSWREDSTNRHLTFTRNRIRHELLPLLEGWNPRLREHLSQMAELARDEEGLWQAEVDRLAPEILLHGRPVRGGGRATSGGLALDVAKLEAQPVALQRRLLRHAAGQLEAAADFADTEALRDLALTGRAGQKLELAMGLRAERSHRELRLTRGPAASRSGSAEPTARYELVIPGEVAAESFGLLLRVELSGPARPDQGSEVTPQTALLRTWQPGDRVTLCHSNGPRKVKEVLERMKVTGSQRAVWPVLEFGNRIIWMRGVKLQPEPGIRVEATSLEADSRSPVESS
jgi:tRNA(Ile)-lysidine synthase